MEKTQQYEFSAAQHRALTRARHLEYLSIAYLASVIALMYIVMGSSQAMKTAWIEDCLSLIPPVCFLLGSHLCWRKPTERFPYGFHRVVSILFLCAAAALLLMGGLLLTDALVKLVMREHPTIGMKSFFGIDLWLGWWMIPVLVWGIVPPVLMGHAKVKYAESLNDKVLMTDGKMNKADWMTGAAATVGVLGIGMGWWWADAAAAALISFDILRDGLKQTADAVTGLMNRAPTSVHDDPLDLPAKIEQALRDLHWVDDATVRLYEHGHLILGEGFVTAHGSGPVSAPLMREAVEKVRALDWRLQDFVITLAEAHAPR